MGDSFKVEPQAAARLGGLVQRQGVGIAAHLKALEHNQVDDIGQGLFPEITGNLATLPPTRRTTPGVRSASRGRRRSS